MSWSAVVALAIGCHAPTPPTAAPPTTAAPAVVAPPPAEIGGVVVDDAGTAPRRPLRYQVATGTQRHLRYQARNQGAAARELELSWDYRFERDGDRTWIAMTMGPTAQPVPAGIAGRWTLDPLGRHAPGTPDDQGRLVLRQTEAELVLPILPTAAIGVGARWTVPIAMPGGPGVADLAGTIRWHLVALDGTRATLAGTVEVPAFELALGGQPVTLVGHGAIEAWVDLAAYTADGRMTLVISDPGGDRRHSDIAIHLTSE